MTAVAPEIGVAAAMHFCRSNNVEPPPWLVDEATELLAKGVRPDVPGDVGRAKTAFARFRQDRIHLARFDSVEYMRRMQRFLLQELDLLRQGFGWPKLRRFRERQHAWFGTTWLRAYECASMYLKETPANGCPETMKASYCLVSKCLKHPKQHYRFHFLDPQFLQTLGLKELEEDLWLNLSLRPHLLTP